jgi:hypothetical protein
MGEWKTSSDDCEIWFGKNGKNSLPVLFVEPWRKRKGGDILYKKGYTYQATSWRVEITCASHTGCDSVRRRIAFTKTLTPLAAVCILSAAIFSRRPYGELSIPKFAKQIESLAANRTPTRLR